MKIRSFSEIVKKRLYGLSKTRLGRDIFSWVLRNMSFALPVKYIKETDSILAFHHPSPAYPFHVLMVPKRQIASLADLSDEDQPFLVEIFSTVQELVQSNALDDYGYRLVVNGGKNQEFGILHFHLISDKEINNTN